MNQGGIMNLITKTTELAMNITLQYIKPDDIVVDATAGNGHDTLTLANAVGQNGKVFAFDIQNKALENTKALLEQHGVLSRVQLINDSHENLEKYLNIEKEIFAIIFNLGYLPSGDKEITSKQETSILAVKAALNIVKCGGVICLVLYSGHDEGKREKEAILQLLESISSSTYHVAYTSMINQKNSPPEIVWITKK